MYRDARYSHTIQQTARRSEATAYRPSLADNMAIVRVSPPTVAKISVVHASTSISTQQQLSSMETYPNPRTKYLRGEAESRMKGYEVAQLALRIDGKSISTRHFDALALDSRVQPITKSSSAIAPTAFAVKL
ncbi:unnamed protein product [Blumeria hordei]|uniref:Uncharacterized protein n=1 Tax=Blumeria hordei TaxID=2867405 RepID=A0A383UJ39_BLUHO|nr:unnamed protein product [Blumeria hordei]